MTQLSQASVVSLCFGCSKKPLNLCKHCVRSAATSGVRFRYLIIKNACVLYISHFDCTEHCIYIHFLNWHSLKFYDGPNTVIYWRNIFWVPTKNQELGSTLWIQRWAKSMLVGFTVVGGERCQLNPHTHKPPTSTVIIYSECSKRREREVPVENGEVKGDFPGAGPLLLYALFISSSHQVFDIEVATPTLQMRTSKRWEEGERAPHTLLQMLMQQLHRAKRKVLIGWFTSMELGLLKIIPLSFIYPFWKFCVNMSPEKINKLL